MDGYKLYRDIVLDKFYLLGKTRDGCEMHLYLNGGVTSVSNHSFYEKNDYYELIDTPVTFNTKRFSKNDNGHLLFNPNVGSDLVILKDGYFERYIYDENEKWENLSEITFKFVGDLNKKNYIIKSQCNKLIGDLKKYRYKVVQIFDFDHPYFNHILSTLSRIEYDLTKLLSSDTLIDIKLINLSKLQKETQDITRQRDIWGI